MRLSRLLVCSLVPGDETTGAARLEENRRRILMALDRAAAFRPDFVVFSEICLHLGIGKLREAIRFAESIPGPSSEMVAAKARELRSHVLLPLLEREGELVYNTVVLLGRDGAILGRYRKYHPTSYEMEDGVQPGESVPVWQTDGGRVGCAICFDLKFPDVGLALSRGKANVVFWPSMFQGGQRLIAWAMDYGFYLVKCTASSGAIVDPSGVILATEGPAITLENPRAVLRWTFAEVNADRRTYHLDFNQEKLPEMVRKYGAGIQIAMNRPEGTFTLASNLPDRTVEDLEREFGLEDLRTYLDRAAQFRERKLLRT